MKEGYIQKNDYKSIFFTDKAENGRYDLKSLFLSHLELLMTETGNAIGSIQIAGTDAITQVPFFITTCDYTLIGEEFYAASAYLSKDPELVSMLKAQDYFKFLIVFFILLGAILSTMHFNWLTNAFPLE